jgi:hypothetical protein
MPEIRGVTRSRKMIMRVMIDGKELYVKEYSFRYGTEFIPALTSNIEECLYVDTPTEAADIATELFRITPTCEVFIDAIDEIKHLSFENHIRGDDPVRRP